MNQEYLYVDIDVDSNNDGVINDFDDAVELGNSQSGSIESGTYGFIVLAGEQFSVNLNTISSRLLDSSIYGVRLLDSEDILDYNNPTLGQTSLTITAEQTGQTTLAYEIYLVGTNQVVARDEVLISVIDCEAFITVDENLIYENWEGRNIAEFTIELNQSQIAPVTVLFTLSGGAEFESDYSIAWWEDFTFDSETCSGSAWFLPGETSKTFCVTAINHEESFISNSLDELYKSVNVTLLSGNNYNLPDMTQSNEMSAFATTDIQAVVVDLDISYIHYGLIAGTILGNEETVRDSNGNVIRGIEDDPGGYLFVNSNDYKEIIIRGQSALPEELKYKLSWNTQELAVYVKETVNGNDIYTLASIHDLYSTNSDTTLYVKALNATVPWSDITARICEINESNEIVKYCDAWDSVRFNILSASVDLRTDSNNDGSINSIDDPIETGVIESDSAFGVSSGEYGVLVPLKNRFTDGELIISQDSYVPSINDMSLVEMRFTEQHSGTLINAQNCTVTLSIEGAFNANFSDQLKIYRALSTGELELVSLNNPIVMTNELFQNGIDFYLEAIKWNSSTSNVYEITANLYQGDQLL